MKRFIPGVLLAAFALVAGCRTPENASASPAPRYTAPNTKQREARVAELQRAGHTREGAERKARKELARDAWQADHSQAWAAERVRAERSARREKMEKELAALDKLP